VYNPYEPSLRAWGGGLVWGGLLLVFAVMLVGLFVDDVQDGRVDSPTLSPAALQSGGQLELDEHRGQLVDVQGFELDCAGAAFDGERLLAPGYGPASELMFVAFEHGSDCAKAAAAFRGRATAMPDNLRAELGLDMPELEGTVIAIVEPHEVGYWMIPALLMLAALGAFGIKTAVSTRQQLIKDLDPSPAPAPAPAEDDKHGAADPYRPGGPGRLITENIALATTFAATLRRARTLQAGLGVVLLGSALVAGVFGGKTIYEREQIWANGELAPNAVAGGETTRSMLIVVRTKLDVTFVDASGRVHREEASAMSLIVGVDDSVAPVVRYLPDDPDHFAVSWIHEQAWGSWALLVLGSLALLAGGIALVVSARKDHRPEQAAAVFDDPREALLELLGIDRQVVNGTETGALTYHFRILESEQGWTHEVRPKGTPPLFLDEAGSIAIALYHPLDATYLLVLSEDLAELQRAPCSPAQLRGRYQAKAAPGCGT
jgi:hypothetical protein